MRFSWLVMVSILDKRERSVRRCYSRRCSLIEPCVYEGQRRNDDGRVPPAERRRHQTRTRL